MAVRAQTAPVTMRNARTAAPGDDPMVGERRVLGVPPHRADGETTTIDVSGRSAATGKVRDEPGIRGVTSQAAPAVNVRRSVPDKGGQGQTIPKPAVEPTRGSPAADGTGSVMTATATAPAGAGGTETTDQAAGERIAAPARTTQRAGRVISPAYGRSRTAGSRRTALPPRPCRTT